MYIPLPFWVTLMSNLNCHFDNWFLKTHFQKIWTSEEGGGVGQWRQGALGLQPTREGNTCRDAALICENLRVGGFKLNINIKKKMRSGLVVTAQRRPKLGCGPVVPAPWAETARWEGQSHRPVEGGGIATSFSSDIFCWLINRLTLI